MDKWMLSKLQKLILACTEAFNNYEYSKAKQELEQFFWNVFCDNYLEIVKDRLYNPGNYISGARESAQYSLYEATLNILKLASPILPHITEEIYQVYFAEKEAKKSIHLARWPQANETLIDESAENAGDAIVAILSAVRKYKSEKSVSLKEAISQVLIECPENIRKHIELALPDLAAAAVIKDINFGEGDIKINDKIKISIIA
jgi:valyl-tRNA synthetase